MIPFSIIVAIDTQNGIGKNGQLPWALTGDLKYFKEVTCKLESPTKKNAVIMGRKTWDSIPEKFRPLPDRINIVLSRNKDLILPPSVRRYKNFEEVFKDFEKGDLKDRIESIYVIGGQQVFEQAIQLPHCQKLFITHIHQSFNCDTFFPAYQSQFVENRSSTVQVENNIEYHFSVYNRRLA